MSTVVGQSEAIQNVTVLLTPPGSGAIGVIRLCGRMNEAFAAAHLSRTPRVGRCVHADLRDGEQILDDIVVVLNDTGSLDLNVHGGPYVTQAVLNLAKRFGYSIGSWQTNAGTALDPADDIEKQMLIDLPHARSKSILRLLTAQPAAWQAMLTASDVNAMHAAIADKALEQALAVPTVAIVGPPNVGKSTLANALFGQDRSITADRPGTTRDWVGEPADLDGLVVRLIDTPGVRATTDAIEAEAIEKAGGVVRSADCVIVTLDGSRPLDEAELEVLKRWNDQKPLIVRTKSDWPILCDIRHVDVDVCAFTAAGLPGLRRLIWQRLGISDLTSPTARCWTDAQRQHLAGRLADAPAGV